jgi:hypothetical protein
MPITEKTKKVIWAHSGNRCCLCRTVLVLQKDEFNRHLNIGEECHIISRQPGGPRHEDLKGFDYDDSSNLLLLCRNHHKTIDERVEEYPAARLQEIKANHEAWVDKNLTAGLTEVAKTEEKDGLSDLLSFITGKHDTEMNIKSSRQIFHSEEGLQIAFSEAEKIKDRIHKTVQVISEKTPGYKIILKDNQYHIVNIIFKGHTFLAQFYQAYNNSANDSYLLFAVTKGLFQENGYADPFHPVEIHEIIRLNFSFNESGEFGWTNQEGQKEFYESIAITDIWTTKFFKKVLS